MQRSLATSFAHLYRLQSRQLNHMNVTQAQLRDGYFVVHTQYGGAPNPLWQFDGLVDLLATTSKG